MEDIIKDVLASTTNGKLRYRKKVLRLACEEGDLDTLRKLIEHGVCVDAADRRGKTALMYACCKGHYGIVELLLNNNVNSNLVDTTSMTALSYAAQHKHNSIVQLLVKYNGDLGKETNSSFPAMMFACQNGDKDMVQTLIKCGIDVNANYRLSNKALALACDNKRIEIVELVLANGAIVDDKDFHGYTALMKACIQGCEDIVRILIRAGADIHAENNRHETSLIKACQGDHKRIVELLISLGADFNGQAYIPLIYAAEAGSLSCAELFLKCGANVNVTDTSGKTALMCASERGKLEMVKLLLKHQADVNLLYYNRKEQLELEKESSSWRKYFLNKFKPKSDLIMGRTALMCACTGGYKDIVDVLISHGANPNVINGEGHTALICACIGKHPEVVEVLLKKSVNLNMNVKCKYERTALMYACKFGMSDAVNALLNHGADPHILSSYQMTTLMYGCFSRSTEVVSLLLKHRVNIDALDSSGETALMISSKLGYHEIISLLLQNGADPNVRDPSGSSAIYYALQSNDTCPKCLEILLDSGADTKLRYDGYHIFTIAVNRNFLEAVKILYRKNRLLSNGRLRPDCKNVFNNLGRKMLTLLIELKLFEWTLCPVNFCNLPSLFIPAIKEGICPGVVRNPGCVKKGLYSPLKLAVARKRLDLTEMIIQHLYFYVEDYQYLKGRKELPEKFAQSQIIKELVTQPLSLFQWSFLIASKSVSLAGHPCLRGKRVDALPIPEVLKRRLKFK